jgi:hypothetical protein
MTSRLGRFRLSIWHVILVLPLFAIGLTRRVPVSDNSFLWHVTAGRVQLDDGSVLTVDPFSFTRGGEPWRTQSWLADLGYAVLDTRWGLGYVSWMTWLLASLFVVGVLLIAYRAAGHVVPTGVVGVMTVVIALVFLNPRPVIFSFPLFALLVLADGDRRLRWASPLILWMWASLHGSFVVGGAYIALQALRTRRWGAWKELVASGVLVSLTAHGLFVWGILVEFTRNREALGAITEWASPDLITLPMAPLFVALIMLMYGGINGAISRRDFVVIVPFLALAFTANRSVLPAWIALVPFVAMSLRNLRFPTRPISAIQGSLNATVMVGLIVGPLILPSEAVIDDERFPIEAALHLVSDRVFHDDSTGGYLIYEQYPDRLVYVDDRAELYGAMITEFVEARGGRAVWREVFERYAIDEVLLPVDQPLVETLRTAGWTEAYEDEHFVVLRP